MGPACALCGESFATEDEAQEQRCFGCDAYICVQCDETAPMGRHKPEDHRE